MQQLEVPTIVRILEEGKGKEGGRQGRGWEEGDGWGGGKEDGGRDEMKWRGIGGMGEEGVGWWKANGMRKVEGGRGASGRWTRVGRWH